MKKGKRILISTFGFDEGKVLETMRVLSYDKLILIVGKDVLDKPGYKKLKEIESKSQEAMMTVTVNVFDFKDCFETVERTIREWNLPPNNVILNISGGTKMLADAALFAGYQCGVEIYHCEEGMVKLPVIRGLSINERFTENQKRLLRSLDDGDTIESIKRKIQDAGMSEQIIRKTIHGLRKMGVIGASLQDGKIRVFWNAGQSWFRTAIREARKI